MEQSRGQLAVYAIAAILVVAAAVKLLSPERGRPDGGPPVRLSRDAAGPGSDRGVYVHVAGAVRRPGLYRLRDSARVAAALQRAGGPARKADLASVNLAARVEDGQQIVVPRAGARPPPGTAASAPGPPAAGGSKLSLASATAEQLDQLEGIGPTLAKRILAHRDAHGGFGSVEELREVEGIGEKRFAALREAVTP
jgi:competence protein ComEA